MKDTDKWATPPEVFNALDLEFSFGFDVCAEHSTAKCAEYWTAEEDALSQDWTKTGGVFGHWLWCNPPYSNIGPWVEKAIQAQFEGKSTVMLVMCDPSVKWFARAQKFASEIRFITNGRLAFHKDGVRQAGNNKGSVIFVFNAHRIGAGHVSFIERDALMAKGKKKRTGEAA